MNNCKHKLLKRKVNNTADLPNPELIQIWDLREGDYNDVYRRMIVKGTTKQIDKYCKDTIQESYKEFDSLNTDAIGYIVYNDYNGELSAEYYIEAIESIWTTTEESKDIDIDLTEKENEE